MPKEVAQAWLKYLREELPTVAFKCSTQKGSVSTRSGGSETFAGSSADCLGAETLLQVCMTFSCRALLSQSEFLWGWAEVARRVRAEGYTTRARWARGGLFYVHGEFHTHSSTFRSSFK